MKKIVNIQSVSDIITNSSSEVFIVSKKEATYINDNFDIGGTCISYFPLTFDFIKNEMYYEHEAISEAINSWINWHNQNKDNIEDKHGYIRKYVNGTYTENDVYEYWKMWCDENKDLLISVFENNDLVWLDIEDHFDYDEYLDAINSINNSFYRDYRH